MAQHSFLQNLLQGQAVEWKTLGEVAVIGTGNSNRQDESENGDYPFYVRSKNVLRSDSYQFDETAIVIPEEGGVGDIFHYVEGKYALHQRAYRICIHDGDINTKFLYHVMRNSFKQYILSKSVGATATSIRKPMLEKFLIPIPPLSVQAKIVQILDTFTELTEQLTAELGMRQKQYQYYRNKLLTFDFEAVQSLATASDSGWHWYGRLWVRFLVNLGVGNQSIDLEMMKGYMEETFHSFKLVILGVRQRKSKPITKHIAILVWLKVNYGKKIHYVSP
ncbi:type I restriction endonuclease subunit S [Moraxella catarrhalis]|nr:type I restriction endonuclease subunit S [Moraxella catarrhalis]RKM48007.1 type I restriction endonuclease subunit S [Moraxella catarrhalis]